MGPSRQSPDLRYLKHVKSRTGRIGHGADNVPIFKLGKFDFAASMQTESIRADNFLGFQFEMFDQEEDHLELRNYASTPKRRKAQRESYMARRAQTLAAEGLSSAAVAKELGIGKSTAHRYMTQARSEKV